MIQANWAKIGLHFTSELDPDPEMDSDLDVDSDPSWIHVIPIPALLDVIPDPDPAKNGIVTPLLNTSLKYSFISAYAWAALIACDLHDVRLSLVICPYLISSAQGSIYAL